MRNVYMGHMSRDPPKERVVVIGGGTGSYTVLNGLKNHDVDLTAIVNMTDDGGSSGVLRDEYGVLPPGDVRRCIAALSTSTESLRKVFQYKFDSGSLDGHSFGNLFITALKNITGSDEGAIQKACEILAVKGKVLPVTLSNSRLFAELENGEVIRGEINIDLPKHDGNLRIKRLYLEPPAKAYGGAIEAIKESDMIVIGPGDLYGSIIANLLSEGLPEAIRSSRAKKAYVCNIMTKFGETNNFMVHDFVDAVESYLGRHTLDYVVYNEAKMDDELLQRYAEEKAFPVNADEKQFSKFKAKFIRGDFVTAPVLARHDSDKIAKTLIDLLRPRIHVNVIMDSYGKDRRI